jgi:hypothetical protein
VQLTQAERAYLGNSLTSEKIALKNKLEKMIAENMSVTLFREGLSRLETITILHYKVLDVPGT